MIGLESLDGREASELALADTRGAVRLGTGHLLFEGVDAQRSVAAVS